MSLARRLAPNQTHFVTRRTRGRTAFLTPQNQVNQTLLYTQDWEPTYPPARRAFRRRRRLARQAERRRLRRSSSSSSPDASPKKRRKRRPPRSRASLPEEVRITISPPPGYEHLSLEEVRKHFRRLLDERIEEIHAQRRAEGKTRVLGVPAIMAQDPLVSIGETFPTFDTNPRIACKEPAQRVALLLGLQRWRTRYRSALDSWTQGQRDARFPAGTYWIAHFHKALVEPTAQPP